MKHYRTAIPAGSRTLDVTFQIWFEDLNPREYVDKDGNPIDVNSLSVDDQNALANWEDDFEDGLNEYDGTYEFSVAYDGSMLRRRAWKVDEAAE